MTRPEDIKARIANIREIESIVSTLRALALAHQLEARKHVDAIREQEALVAGALSTALSLAGTTTGAAADGPGIAIIVGAAQGFSGTFGDRLAEAAIAEARRGAGLLLVGGHTLGALEDHAVAPLWFSEMAAHAAEIPALANRLADATFGQLTRMPGAALLILFADPDLPGQPLVRRTLFPFDFTRFPPSTETAPLLTLPAANLLAALVEEYVFAELCEALMLGFAAESAARAAAMARAQNNVKRIAGDLKIDFQRSRQEQMTTEIVELTAAASAAARTR